MNKIPTPTRTEDQIIAKINAMIVSKYTRRLASEAIERRQTSIGKQEQNQNHDIRRTISN